MRVLVTGGAGFIGSHVSEELIRNGHEVCVYDNFNDFYLPLYKHNNAESIIKLADDCKLECRVVNADIRDSSALSECFEAFRFDCVVHLAACAGVRPSIENTSLYMEVNVNGLVQLLECMKAFGVKKLLFASSSSVYGNNKKIPFSEEDNVDRPLSPYAATKKAGEVICHTYHHLYDIDVACLRFFTVYGPRQRPDLAIYKFTDMIFKNQPIPFYGDGTMGRDYTYIDDIVSGVMGALKWIYTDKKQYDIFNLGGDYTVSLADMVHILSNEIGVSAKINRLSISPGDVVITSADIEKSRKVLGYTPSVHFNDGIKKFIEWYKQHRL